MNGSSKNHARPADAGETGAAITLLLLAAKEDAAFRQRVRFVLSLPTLQRQSLVNTALHEMTLRGEPQAVQTAFAVLATDAGAEAAMRFLNAE